MRFKISKVDTIISIVLISLIVLRLLGFLYVIVLSDSMKPTINTGDLIITSPINKNNIHINDVIIYEKDFDGTKVLISHRVTNITEFNGVIVLRTKGDNRKYVDPWVVHYNEIMGHVIYKIPYIGLVILFTIFHKYLFILTIFSIIMIIGVFDTIRRTIYFNEKKLNRHEKYKQYEILRKRKKIMLMYNKKHRGVKNV